MGKGEGGGEDTLGNSFTFYADRGDGRKSPVVYGL